MHAKKSYDAVVIGSGPNGLAAAIVLAQKGFRVKIFEAHKQAGGGTRTDEITLPGFKHDICSAIHPLAFASPFLSQLPLSSYGLEWIHPEIPLAHPLDGGRAVPLFQSLSKTSDSLGIDKSAYEQIYSLFVQNWEKLSTDILGPLKWPDHPALMARFGIKALRSAVSFCNTSFQTAEARALFAGLAAHSILPLHKPATSAIGLVLGILAHKVGWPFPKGGAQQITRAMEKYFWSLGGTVETEYKVTSLDELPASRTYFFDTTPHQMARICGDKLSSLYKFRLSRYKPGHGVFKIDAALGEPIPWLSDLCRKAGTVHLGGTMEEICASEKALAEQQHAKKPYVLVAQQSLFDSSRAPADKHTLWAYCHVPNGSTQDMTEPVFSQIERFAPGFRDCVLDMSTLNTAELESYNPNYIGGDINGGHAGLTQLFTRPVAKLVPYQTSARDIFLCSSSTPPGGGVHGMCGYHAAFTALKRELS